MRKLDRLYEKAKELREIKEELPGLLAFSEIPLKDICKEAGISLKKYNRLKSGEQDLTSKHIIKLISAVISLSARKDLVSTRKEFSHELKLNGHLVVSYNLTENEREKVAKITGMSLVSIKHFINGSRKLFPSRAKDILHAIIEIQDYWATEIKARRN